MKVIIYNDDFATSYGFTEAIKDAYLKGITTATCIRPNGTAYKYSVCMAKTKLKGLSMGIHLNLTDGPTHLPGLANKEGLYKHTFMSYYIALLLKDKDLEKNIEKELDYQFKMVLNDGLKIDHVNGQDHIHMIPQIFKIICKLCKKYKIDKIRLSDEPYFLTGNIKKDIQPFLNTNIIKNLLLHYFSKENKRIIAKYNMKTPDRFYGLLHTNYIDILAIESAIQHGLRNNYQIIEVLGHPAYPNDPRDTSYTTDFTEGYIKSAERKGETDTFTKPAIKKMLQKYNIQQASYKDVK